MSKSIAPSIPERPVRRADLVSEELEGMDEVIYIDNATGSTFSLNTTASIILDLCDGSRTADDIAKLLSETLSVPFERSRRDTEAMLEELAVYELIGE